VFSNDLAGNASTSYFQLTVTASTKTVSSVFNTDPEKASTYVGTDSGAGVSVFSSAGDVILTNGGDDVISLLKPESYGFARIDGGAGFDRISFSGTDIEVDFAVFNNPDGSGQVIEHVEAFTFSGSNSVIAITAADLFHLRSDALDVDGKHQLVRFMANSTNGGSVALDGLAQVGDKDYFDSKGAKSTGSEKYTKFVGLYVDGAGDHLVELLLQRGLTAG